MNAIKLNKIGNNGLTNDEKLALRGGESFTCKCGCCYANSGGSDTLNNFAANFNAGGKKSTACETKLELTVNY